MEVREGHLCITNALIIIQCLAQNIRAFAGYFWIIDMAGQLGQFGLANLPLPLLSEASGRYGPLDPYGSFVNKKV